MTGYAVRRLNPFAGVAQVVTTDNARAISLDGRRWEIQVLAEAPNDCWGSLNSHMGAIRFFRFGIWSPDKGLSRVPINPIMDVGAMLDAAEALLAELERNLPDVPLPLRDDRELWLLDSHGQPLALMMSATEDEDLDSLRPRHWSAAPMHDRNLGRERQDGEIPVADDIERMVRRQSGSGRAYWFRREAPGAGIGRPLDTDAAVHPDLPASAFPQLPVRHSWEDPENQALTARWIGWAAPRLLCLPYLDPGMRGELEAIARQAAFEVSALWRLYPHDVNPEFVRSARVEAEIRRSAESA